MLKAGSHCGLCGATVKYILGWFIFKGLNHEITVARISCYVETSPFQFFVQRKIEPPRSHVSSATELLAFGSNVLFAAAMGKKHDVHLYQEEKHYRGSGAEPFASKPQGGRGSEPTSGGITEETHVFHLVPALQEGFEHGDGFI